MVIFICLRIYIYIFILNGNYTHTHTVVYSLPFQMSVYVFFLTLSQISNNYSLFWLLFVLTSPCEQNEAGWAGQPSIFIV